MAVMLIAFVDESYTSDRYYIAAYLIHSNDLPLLDEAFRKIHEYAKGFGVVGEPELHAHRLMGGDDGWEAVRGKARASIAIYRSALTNIVEVPGKMIVRGVDVTRLNGRYRYPHPPHQVVLQHLLENINEYALGQAMPVKIIADHIDGEQGHHDQAEKYKLTGTPGYRTSKLQQVVLPIEFEDSAEFPGLQVADLIAYIYRRVHAHQETNERAARAAEALWGELKPIWQHVWTWEP